MQYFIKRKERTFGPFTKEQVNQLLREKKIGLNDQYGPSSDGPFQKFQTESSKAVSPVQSQTTKHGPSSSEFYYLNFFGIPRGPFSWTQFIDLVKEGKIKAKTGCIMNDESSRPACEFFSNWESLEQVFKQNELDREKLEDEKKNDSAAQKGKSKGLFGFLSGKKDVVVDTGPVKPFRSSLPYNLQPTKHQVELALDLGIKITPVTSKEEISELIQAALDSGVKPKNQDKPSQSQLNFAARLGIQVPGNALRMEVSGLIDKALAIKDAERSAEQRAYQRTYRNHEWYDKTTHEVIDYWENLCNKSGDFFLLVFQKGKRIFGDLYELEFNVDELDDGENDGASDNRFAEITLICYPLKVVREDGEYHLETGDNVSENPLQTLIYYEPKPDLDDDWLPDSFREEKRRAKELIKAFKENPNSIAHHKATLPGLRSYPQPPKK